MMVCPRRHGHSAWRAMAPGNAGGGVARRAWLDAAAPVARCWARGLHPEPCLAHGHAGIDERLKGAVRPPRQGPSRMGAGQRDRGARGCHRAR